MLEKVVAAHKAGVLTLSPLDALGMQSLQFAALRPAAPSEGRSGSKLTGLAMANARQMNPR
jgi:hypothetical protein